MSAGTSEREGAAVPATPASTYAPGAGRSGKRFRSTSTAYGFLTPNLVLLGLFLFLPLGWAFLISFQESSGFGASGWVGLDNYRRLVTDPTFWQSTANTGL